MKLLFVTCIKEHQQAVASIFEAAQIKVFSVLETIGYKDGQPDELLDNWFASGKERFDSQVLFSFTSQSCADKAMELIRQSNAENNTGFPIRAFIMPVEQTAA